MLAGDGGGGGLWGYWTVGADRGWQRLVALAGLNRPMGLTIIKIARKVAQTTLLLCVPWEIAPSFVLKSLLCGLNFHKMLLWRYDVEIKQISSGSANHNYVFGDFCKHSNKTWKGWPNFFKFQSMSILAIRCKRRKETVSVPIWVLNNKTGPLFLEFNWCEDTF